MDSVLPCHDVLEGRAFAGLDGVSSRLVGWRSLSFQVKDELWRLLFWPVGHVRTGRNKRELPTILEDVDVDVGERIGWRWLTRRYSYSANSAAKRLFPFLLCSMAAALVAKVTLTVSALAATLTCQPVEGCFFNRFFVSPARPKAGVLTI